MKDKNMLPLPQGVVCPTSKLRTHPAKDVSLSKDLPTQAFLMLSNQWRAKRKISVKRVFHEPAVSQSPVVWLRSEENLPPHLEKSAPVPCLWWPPAGACGCLRTNLTEIPPCLLSIMVPCGDTTRYSCPLILMVSGTDLKVQTIFHNIY